MQLSAGEQFDLLQKRKKEKRKTYHLKNLFLIEIYQPEFLTESG